MRFRYFVIHRDERRDDPRGLFVIDADGGPHPFYRAAYSHLSGRWEFSPGVDDYLYGDWDDRTEEVDRSGAEAVARARDIPLPDDAELERIVLDATTRH